jgi:hypothetical protein
MGLAQLGIKRTQAQLARLFGARIGVGTPFPNIDRLSQWRVTVQRVQWQSIDKVVSALAANMSVIAAVTTTQVLPGWGHIRTQHTLLILTVTNDEVTYHDPALPDGPVNAALDEFLLAWSEMAEQAAFLSRM